MLNRNDMALRRWIAMAFTGVVLVACGPAGTGPAQIGPARTGPNTLPPAPAMLVEVEIAFEIDGRKIVAKREFYTYVLLDGEGAGTGVARLHSIDLKPRFAEVAKASVSVGNEYIFGFEVEFFERIMQDIKENKIFSRQIPDRQSFIGFSNVYVFKYNKESKSCSVMKPKDIIARFGFKSSNGNSYQLSINDFPHKLTYRRVRNLSPTEIIDAAKIEDPTEIRNVLKDGRDCSPYLENAARNVMVTSKSAVQ